jgi:hypothetical protein
LHALVSRASPSHGFPFIWGLGELQSRILVITPSPHVTEQDDHGDQWLQPPSCLTTVQSGCHKQCWLTAILEALPRASNTSSIAAKPSLEEKLALGPCPNGQQRIFSATAKVSAVFAGTVNSLTFTGCSPGAKLYADCFVCII